ncbi:BQ5605_C004g02688 [Microbotryum silenes-dioicae]|uniref:BQ5605_C004g02688 protein n=1 Tax=Microbotryum silenes-dioicae TaxID=796604 RepID=A0A2X0MCZ5_9BASI|nr:BQ5605_C004g02688 [Microbotryum silenes-dioicae]
MRARSRLDKAPRRSSAVPQSAAAAPHHNTLYTASPSEAIQRRPAILPDCSTLRHNPCTWVLALRSLSPSSTSPSIQIAQLFSSPDEPNKDSEPLT